MYFINTIGRSSYKRSNYWTSAALGEKFTFIICEDKCYVKIKSPYGIKVLLLCRKVATRCYRKAVSYNQTFLCLISFFVLVVFNYLMEGQNLQSFSSLSSQAFTDKINVLPKSPLKSTISVALKIFLLFLSLSYFTDGT